MSNINKNKRIAKGFQYGMPIKNSTLITTFMPPAFGARLGNQNWGFQVSFKADTNAALPKMLFAKIETSNNNPTEFWLNIDNTNDNKISIAAPDTSLTPQKIDYAVKQDEIITVLYDRVNGVFVVNGVGGAARVGSYQSNPITFFQGSATVQLTYYGAFRFPESGNDTLDTQYHEKYKKLLHNRGQGVEIYQGRLAKEFPADTIFNFEPKNRTGLYFGYEKGANGLTIASTNALDYETSTNLYKYLNRRIGKVIKKGLPWPTQSTYLRDFIFRDALHSFPNKGLMGKFERSPAEVAATGVNATAMPNSWAGKNLNLTDNKWGGTTSTETTITVITNAKCNLFYGQRQTPAGWDELYIEYASDFIDLEVYQARKKKVVVTSEGNVVRQFRRLYIYSNSLEQTYESVCDPDIMQWQYFHASNTGTGFTGAITKLSPRAIAFYAENCTGLTGEFPANFPSTMTTLVLHGSGLTALNGYDFKQLTSVYWNSDQVTGVLKFSKIWDLRSAWTHANGYTLDFTTLVTGRHLGYIANTQANKVKNILLPTTAGAMLCVFAFPYQDFGPIDFGTRTDVIFDKGFGWTGVGTTFDISHNSNIHDYIFPIGSKIITQIIKLENIGLSSANVNANLALYLDNITLFDGVNQPKRFGIHGLTNGPVTERLADLKAACVSRNIYAQVKTPTAETLSMFKVYNVAKGPNIDEIIIHINMKPFPQYAGDTVYMELDLFANTALNGVWEYVYRGTDAAATNGQTYSDYWKLRKTGFDNTTLTTQEGLFIMKHDTEYRTL